MEEKLDKQVDYYFQNMLNKKGENNEKYHNKAN